MFFLLDKNIKNALTFKKKYRYNKYVTFELN